MAGILAGLGSSPSDGSNPVMWLETAEISKQLRISRQTLWRLRRRRLLKEGQHWTRKTPGCARSDILWHAIRCKLALGRGPH